MVAYNEVVTEMVVESEAGTVLVMESNKVNSIFFL